MKKPFQTYFGGKESNGTFQTIINHIRPHEYFFELFGGNFTISRKLNCDSFRFVNDVSKRVYSKYPKSTEKFKFFNLDYQDFLTEANTLLNASSVVYIDAPYLLDSRKSNRNVYDCEFHSPELHTKMLSTANELKNVCDILISHYPHPLYFEKLKDWHYVEFESMTRNGKAKEGLWMNYPAPTALADYSYLGKNRTDRQRIKRRARLLKNKIKALPILEKKALLNEILRIS